MTAPQKTLYILRHAKAEPALPGQDDHDRPLAERGAEEAARMGQYFALQHILLEQIICSTSRRTRATWEGMCIHYASSAPVEYSEKLYLSSAGEMIRFLGILQEQQQHVLLIGHNPGLHELCLKLIHRGDERTIKQLAGKFPPCALAVLQFDNVTWDSVHQGGTLVDYRIPDSL